jgi:hypothetical protein
MVRSSYPYGVRRKVRSGNGIKWVSPSIKSSCNPHQQIRQPVSRQNHTSISNPARVNNVARRKHGSRSDHRAIHTTAFWNPYPPVISVSDLRRNLETLFSPQLKVGTCKFAKLASLKFFAVS